MAKVRSYSKSKLTSYSTVFIAFFKVSVIPHGQFVSMPGGNATFTCINTGINNIQWLVNETEFESLNLDNARQDYSSLQIGGLVSTLMFTNIPLEYNTTRIQCRIENSNEVTLQSQSSLFLQGWHAKQGWISIINFDDEIIECSSPLHNIDAIESPEIKATTRMISSIIATSLATNLQQICS